MKLYHNADLEDLESIVKTGLLPMSVTGNDKWNNGKRVENSKEVVYLFSPTVKGTALTQFGAAMIEVEVEDAEHSEMDRRDVNRGKIEEYTVGAVAPERIVKIMIPEVFKTRIELSEEVAEKVEWCSIGFDIFRDSIIENYDTSKPDWDQKMKAIYTAANEAEVELFGKTAALYVGDYCYFHGIDKNGDVFNVKNVKYF